MIEYHGYNPEIRINVIHNLYRWADQCKPTPHDKNKRTDNFSFVGQNYAWRSYSNPEREKNLLGGMVEMWYNEVTKNLI